MVSQEEKQPDQDLLKLEYQEAVSHSRFIVGIRFSYFISFITIFFALVGAFHYVWISEAKALEQLKPGIMLAIAMFGFYMVVVAIIIERRNIQLYRAADNRAADLERLMGIKGGIRQIYVMPWRTQYFFGITVTHSMGVAMFYRAVAFIWIALALFSVYKILSSFLQAKEVCCG